MCQLAINIPDAVLYDTRMSRAEACDFARRAVALGYYTQNGVSIGYCAQIAGMTEEDFIKYLGKNHVSIFQFDNDEEFLEEMNRTQGYCKFNPSDCIMQYWKASYFMGYLWRNYYSRSGLSLSDEKRRFCLSSDHDNAAKKTARYLGLMHRYTIWSTILKNQER